LTFRSSEDFDLDFSSSLLLHSLESSSSDGLEGLRHGNIESSVFELKLAIDLVFVDEGSNTARKGKYGR